ncbi:hypothetical protein JVX91_20275 [Pseudomonas sp. PDNC002]|uniref:LuxR C-terminal-related transcriptional regulator n=1 Tax=Pseudomonas sp. PDNC002 TaxID=2811422 RepID=UPI0019642766|nr:LuxR C-terminal-related transcriptional regulator [Pseudomonas sp. PDNC002]QRY77921.1 hypothetical protein JVX91_20275 [Pseudomonas sp. PDNC002]
MQALGVSSYCAHTHVAGSPALPDHHVPRPLLAGSLGHSQQRLVLLCAPAGYGKTVLLGESFGLPAPGQQTLWMPMNGRAPSLDDLCQDIATRLNAPNYASPSGLLRFFSLPGCTIRILLDDLSGDLSIELNNWFEQLLDLPSSRVRLVVSCRQRPAWDLPRLLLRGELLELGPDVLAMSHLDYESLCSNVAPKISDPLRESIQEQAAGWWGGACLLLAGGQQGEAMLREYLQRTVLARLDDEERRLLHGLCHLPRFSTELCTQLWEGNGGALLLMRLRHQQVFIQSLDRDGKWYRMQPLVARVLQGGIDPAELSRLRLHACRLLSLAGHLHDAIDQALCARQPEVAASYIERLRPNWQLADLHLAQVLDWRRQLPETLVQGTPRLVYLGTLALLLSGRLDEAGRSLECLARFLPAASGAGNRLLLAHWQALRGGLHAFRGEVRDAEWHCREALGELGFSPADWLSRLLCQFTLGRVRAAAGRLDEALGLWRDALEQARRQGCLDSEALLQGECLRVLMLAGEAELAEMMLTDSLDGRIAAGLERDPVLARLLIARAELMLMGGHIDESEESLRAAQHHARQCSAPFLLLVYQGFAEVAARRGNTAAARMHLSRGERAMHCGLIDKDCYQPALALQELKLLAHSAQWGALLEASRPLVGQYPVGGELSTLLPPTLPHEIQWLVAQAEHHLGRRAQSRTRLQMLASDCSRYGFRQLQAQVLGFLQRQDETAESEGADAAGYQEELTAREAAVLEQLANGLSNQEIADALFLSVNTVKYHAKNINAKLGTTRRTQAIACAKARGLLA